ncbi:MAG: amidohydrolase [Anaerolineaceae bacterium]|nr:amidohydrolase [Anaerolineaceae bacterium]
MILFHNGIIHTIDRACPQAEALRVRRDGKIAALGSYEALRSDGVLEVDLGGRTLMPGFNDAHVHVPWLGDLLTRLVNVTAGRGPDIATLVQRFRERAEQEAPGTWIQGGNYNENFLAEGRHPTRADLDAASDRHPLVVVHTSWHAAVANSLALEWAGITRDTADPFGGHIGRDENGEPNGYLAETAMLQVLQHIPQPTAAQRRASIRACHEHQLSLGITSATDPNAEPVDVAAYRELDAAGQLAVRMNLLVARRSGDQDLPLPERHLSDFLRMDAVKFFADGGLTSATAAISQPYKETATQGLLIYEDEELADRMWEAHAAGFQMATHANGDVALKQVLDIYEALDRRLHQPGLMHRIEHLALPTQEQVAQVARLGVGVAMQAVFLPAMGATYRRYLPDEFIPRAYPAREVLDAGIPFALSTDAPVVPDDNPLIGLKAAVDRLDHRGEALGPAQAITREEAIYAYTMGGAILSGDAGNRGSLTPGKWADVIVLSGDPLTTPTADLLSLRVEETYVAGERVFRAED